MKQETINNIVKATGVSAGELVLIHFWGEDKDKEIANKFYIAVASLGASPFLLQQARTVNRNTFLVAGDSCFDERYFNLFSGFDAVIDVFAYRPVILGFEIEQNKFELYRKYMAQLFSRLMQEKRFTQIRIPTAANAEESGLGVDDYIHRMTNAYDIDYDELYAACKKKKEALQGAKQVSLHTGQNCVLHFDLSGREWHIDAGNGDLPCGEVYIAPNEAKTQGFVYFETLFIEDCGKYEQVRLTIENGKVVRSNNAQVTAYFENLSGAERTICELGFGMNPKIKDLCGYTILDEKMAGTFHIAIGANNMFGGTNAASIHIDFVGFGKGRC